MAEYSDFFLDGANLQSSTAVYTTSALTTFAADGYYSDGLVVRRQVTGIGLLPVEDCPACGEFNCEKNITIQPVTASQCRINYKMNASLGAIKVTISGITQSSGRPIGISLRGTGDLTAAYNTFSSTGLSGITNNVITAPSNLVPSYFYVNGMKVCQGWTNGSAELPEYKYNPNTGLFAPTGTTSSFSYSNKMTTPSNGLPTTVGDIVTYIPKTTAALDTINVVAVYPCGGPTPTVNVECPTALYDFQGNLSLTTEENNADACDNGSIGGRKLVHGKVRGTVNGQFKNGDYIFETNVLGSGIYTELADGYWKSVRSNFPEATGGGANNFCSFKVTNNIISSVQACQ